MGEDKIRFDHVRKEFPGVIALKDISFSVKKGEVHALLGENGAGKSTLLNILHGVFTATSGQILLDGKPANYKDPVILVGASESYEARCRHCHCVPGKKTIGEKS